MKKMAGLLIGFFLVNAMLFATPPKRYLMPQSIQLQIFSLSQVGAPEPLSASIKSLIGNPTEIQLFFESSEDLEISSKTASLETLASGTTKEFKLSVAYTKNQADVGGSWARIRVSYLPDYKALADEVSKNLLSYSNEMERNQLLKSLQKCLKNKQKDIQAVRFFFPDKKK
ncbi:MAG: hypothetical protein HQM08_10050 [Candidatus Riflebacteria bacterium]|nr:hypothetical protein [Candidatus Riflebacteria bacterium]